METGKKDEEWQIEHSREEALGVKNSLFEHLEILIQKIFSNERGEEIEMRWVDSTFPFTYPSYEMEIRPKPKLGGKEPEDGGPKWTEVLGCGILHQNILSECFKL